VSLGPVLKGGAYEALAGQEKDSDMKKRVKKFEDTSPVEFLLLREKLGLKRYRKTTKRDEEKRKILLELASKKIEEKEKDDFIPLGYRRRKVKIS
jgi:vacuolar-type H+-ATPase subunit F/Vma7